MFNKLQKLLLSVSKKATFTYVEKFSLSFIGDKLIVHCTCSKSFEIANEIKLDSPLLNCPHCAQLWHFEVKKDSILLIRPRTNSAIFIKNNELFKMLDNKHKEYYLVKK